MNPEETLQLVRRTARRNGHNLVDTGRGKGSHQVYEVQDADGKRVGQFTLTNHPRDLSWPVLRSIETALTPLFGEKWMEKR